MNPTCEHCETEFHRTNPRQRYCSAPCRNRAWLSRQRRGFTLDQIVDVMNKLGLPATLSDEIIDGLVDA